MKSGEWFDAEYFGDVPVKEQKSNYSRVGGYTDAYAAADQFVPWALEEVKKRKFKVESVLDVGCAMGATVREFQKHGLDAQGIDISAYIIDQAPNDIRSSLMVCGIDDLSEQFPEEKWDLITSKDVLEHYDTEAQVVNALRTLAAHCKVQVHVVNTGEYDYQAFGGDQSHGVKLPLARWQELADEAGAKVIFKAT